MRMPCATGQGGLDVQHKNGTKTVTSGILADDYKGDDNRATACANGATRHRTRSLQCEDGADIVSKRKGDSHKPKAQRKKTDAARVRDASRCKEDHKTKLVSEEEGASLGNDESQTLCDADMESSMAMPEPVALTYGLAFARENELHFQHVQAVEGTVSVANALCVNSSYTGILCVPSRTDTGAQRALRGDEIFYVQSGHVCLEIHDHRYALRPGDHVAIPHMACYAFLNNGTKECRLVFFVPRNPFG
jgi:mannose-6-phosphate isomerase-like protein (cupin superfamily)